MVLPEFLKKTPGLWRMGLILLLGVALLLFSSGQGKSETRTDAEGDLSAYGAALEKRLEDMCERVVGVGDARVMVTFESGAAVEYSGSGESYTRPPKVQGVTVLCAGGAEASVRASLSGMLSALLGVGASHICILPLAP
ncbi:MAG: hypothetical protein IJZ24_04430 [Clostridia bacterium]|nr:hypothetical protein [Clostridia bacterium]